MSGGEERTDANVAVYFASETGHAKACARRAARRLTSLFQSKCGGCIERISFDEIDFIGRHAMLGDEKRLAIIFISTTGDAEMPSSIQRTWNLLLSKSLSTTILANLQFALFALGDRAYGPDAFCAAGRKLAARMAQLGAQPLCNLGYGDDGSPNGGVFADLDVWLDEELIPIMKKRFACNSDPRTGTLNESPFTVSVEHERPLAGKDSQMPEWHDRLFNYSRSAANTCPQGAYQYNSKLLRISKSEGSSNLPLLGTVTLNERITAEGWIQNTRHIKINVVANDAQSQALLTPEDANGHHLPYQAGDIAAVIPSNSTGEVDRFLAVLPTSIRSMADCILDIQVRPSSQANNPWPEKCTLRGLLTHCADLQGLPEREDLFSLAQFCNPGHHEGVAHQNKLLSLSETSGAALYGDYIIREKRNWADVFYDFDSLRWEGSSGGKALLTIEHLLAILPSIAPRYFSIASSPSHLALRAQKNLLGFEIELCIAVVEGMTPRGRKYTGLCSTYLSKMASSSRSDTSNLIRMWIRPGSFSNLPIQPATNLTRRRFFDTPVLCIGAGTGIAPLRALIMEREANWKDIAGPDDNDEGKDVDNILVYGSRKKAKDYYYGVEWEKLVSSNRLRTILAFSRDQPHKFYVQRALREADGGDFIVQHLIHRKGAVYIAGGSKMARAVKDEILESLSSAFSGGERDAKKFMNKLKRRGLLSIEAWS